jgi:hypothetical protein
MIYYARFLDDIFGIWRGSIESLHAFKLQLQIQIGINLTIELSSKGIVMLDCYIYKGPSLFTNNTLDIRTHIKPTNLFQFITNTSFHPKSTLKSLVINQLQRFVITNTERVNYLYYYKQFYRQLRARGYHHNALYPLFNSISFDMRHTLLTKPRIQTSLNRCILICKFTPLSKALCLGKIVRDHIHILLSNTSTNKLGTPLIAYSRAPNVSELVKKFTPKF